MIPFADFVEKHLFSCSVKSLLGIECPGCGMQRAFVALLRGHLAESLSLNASLLPFLVTLLFTGLHLAFGFKNGARWIVILFSITAVVMFTSFVVKLAHHH